MKQQEDNLENTNRCSGHEAVPDSELHRLLRHRLRLPEPRGSNALTDEERAALEGKVRECSYCRSRLGILERSEGLRREESEQRLTKAAEAARIAPERMAEIRTAYEEQLARGFRLRSRLTARPLSEEASNLGDVGAENLKRLREAVEADDQDKLVSLLSPESSLVAADPVSAWSKRTELLLEKLLSEVRDSDDRETRKSLEAAEDLCLTRNQGFYRSPFDVSRFNAEKHFICFLIVLGYLTFLRLLKQSPEPHRATALGRPLSSGNQLDFSPLFRPVFRPVAQVSAVSQGLRTITLGPHRD